MQDALSLHGCVLKSSNLGEYDRRLVILTKERGKITAFAKGAGRTTNPLLGRTRPMAFGEFRVFPGKDAYRLISAEITNYFDELALDFDAIAYACYFMELADYYGREYVDGKDSLNLLYVSFQALKKKVIPVTLVRCIYELKTFVVNGEYPIPEQCSVSEVCAYTMYYIIEATMDKLYTFTVTSEVETELRQVLDGHMKEFVGKKFQSLDLLVPLV